MISDSQEYGIYHEGITAILGKKYLHFQGLSGIWTEWHGLLHPEVTLDFILATPDKQLTNIWFICLEVKLVVCLIVLFHIHCGGV